VSVRVLTRRGIDELLLSEVPRHEQPIYSIGAIERMLGISAATIRNWEARYGLLTPERSPGGHRLYTRSQVDQLRFLKVEVDRGSQPGEAHRVLAERIAAGEPLSADEYVAGPRMLIMLAERDRYAAEFSEFFLRTEGYETVLALDVSEAELKLADRRPDLAVIEVMISGGMGADLCRRFKDRGVPACLVVSGLQYRDAALSAGADAFLRKPLDPLEFVSTIKDLLGRSAFLRGRRDTPT
jgi:DNA-binding transcriptional MerR regulator